MKLAIVVGHNAVAKGARAKAPISTDEYTYNNLIADEMVRLATGALTAKKFLREKSSGYSAEIDAAYAQVDQYGADLSLELHFNAAGATATGTETLSSGSRGSLALAKAVQDSMLEQLELRNRGVKILGRTDRGGRSLHVGRAPAILVEPFFGSNTRDCRAADKLDITGMAEMYLAGVRTYGRLPQVTPLHIAAPEEFLVDVPVVHSGLTRAAFLKRNRSSLRKIIKAINKRIMAEQHGEEINELTLQDACALMHAQIGMKNGKVDGRHVHEQGNTGLLPLPVNLTFWNGPAAPRPDQVLTPERNVKEYLLYLAELKNKDIGQTFWGGSLYRDLFTQADIVDNAKKQTAVLAAIVHGYFDTGNFNLGLPYAEISRRVVAAEKDPAPLLSLLAELGYRAFRKDPNIVDARIADLKEGLRLSRG